MSQSRFLPLVSPESREKTRLLMKLPNQRALEMSKMLVNQRVAEVEKGLELERAHVKNLTRRSSGPRGSGFDVS